ncbi:hypothetical protein PR048_001673 [Dryococelus australis]|uniref:Retrotransposon gag domain-containing protein n=1 Tax=Dryococelus australis TaxID=614101 RepID=A0ABQ9IHY4_9NEOP|nr:hypothetical protein PR048_001673 [Dryococelus australis]
MAVATPLIGAIGEFQLEREDFSSYLECFGQFLKLNAISEDKQVPYFLTVVGAEIYGILKSLLVPDLPSETSYAKHVSALWMHFSPKLMVIAECYEFNSHCQKPDETVSDYIVALKHLAKSCDFKEFFNDALWDHFMCGLKNEHIRKKNYWTQT